VCVCVCVCVCVNTDPMIPDNVFFKDGAMEPKKKIFKIRVEKNLSMKENHFGCVRFAHF